MVKIETFVMVIGMVSMFWRILLKYSVLDFIYKFASKKGWCWFPELCVMCVTFWVCLVLFLTVDPQIGLFYNSMRALSATPFVLELTRKEWK